MSDTVLVTVTKSVKWNFNMTKYELQGNRATCTADILS